MADENENNNTDGGALRKQLEEALKAQNEMKARLAEFEAKERQATVGSVLAAKGFNAKLARFVPDEVGADEAKLTAWLNENADVFGAPAPAGDQAAPAAPSVPEGAAEAFNRIEKVGAAGTNQIVDLAALQAQIKAAKNPEELNALMAQYKLS
jgi:hypothetical protein